MSKSLNETKEIPLLNAHALGGWLGRTYVNSRQAFMTAYRRGFRNFEVDISCTCDGFYVAKHGSALREGYALKDFLSNSTWNETRMILEDIVALMNLYPSVVVMFDFHPCLYDLDNQGEMRRFLSALPKGDIRSRCMVEAYSETNMLPVVEDRVVVPIMGWQPHTFSGSLLECADWCKANGVRHISVSASYCISHLNDVSMVKSRGLVLYSCGWRSYEGLKQAAKLGVDVATVDFLVPGGALRNWFHGYLKRGVVQRIGRCYRRIFCNDKVHRRHLKPMLLGELQRVELDLVKHFHRFCEVNGLKYFLAYGSLIGAVRHKGPIPWDDDIDVYMPRPDYDKFCACYSDSLRYKLFSALRGNAFIPFSRLCEVYSTWFEVPSQFANEPTGVFIDIFPLDGTHADVEAHNAQMKRYEVLKRRLEISRIRFKLLLSSEFSAGLKYRIEIMIKSLVYAIIFRKGLLRKACAMQKEVSYESAQWVTNFSDRDGRDKLHMPKEWFSSVALLPYSDTRLCAPIGYDQYLTNYYGDYMSPPPCHNGLESENTHGKAFWRC